jgi:hypothetical protein
VRRRVAFRGVLVRPTSDRVIYFGLTMSVSLPLLPRKRRYSGHRDTSHLVPNRKYRSTSLIEIGIEQVTSLVRADINYGGASPGRGTKLNARLMLLHI